LGSALNPFPHERQISGSVIALLFYVPWCKAQTTVSNKRTTYIVL